MNLSNKIKPKIEKVINRFPTKAVIFRCGFDKYNQPTGEEYVCDITGFYHEESSKISVNLEDMGKRINNRPTKMLMVLINQESSQIKKGDIIYLLNNMGMRTDKFTIEDLGDLNRMGIYYDLLLGETK